MRGGLASSSGAAGAYHRDDGEFVLTIDRSYKCEPAQLVAVIAHELGHVRLLGENRITVGQRADHEPLTDLLTVYLRLGVFTANAALSFSKSTNLRCTAWSAQRLGYITEQMFGYELACWAMQRGEPDPPRARYLETNPRACMKHGIRYLRHNPDPVITGLSYASGNGSERRISRGRP